MNEDNVENYLNDFEKFLEDHPEHRKSYELFQDMADESHRGKVLIIAAELDRMLGLAIRHSLNDGAGLKELDKDNQGPISTFSSKINLAHALGIVADQEHRDLHLIRKVRNDFAHSSSVSLFDQSTSARISELSMSSKLSDPDKNLDSNAAFLIGQLAAAIEGAKITSLPILPIREWSQIGKAVVLASLLSPATVKPVYNDWTEIRIIRGRGVETEHLNLVYSRYGKRNADPLLPFLT